ncbi:ComEC/Rec2 family competence protein [Nocardia farcinica]|nr:ComEC/Rec2 family competence protein [Nocardia farcinica]
MIAALMARAQVVRSRAEGTRVGDASADTGERGTARDLLDVRLLPTALACWLATIAAVRGGWLVGVAVAVVCAATGAAAWIGTVHRPGLHPARPTPGAARGPGRRFSTPPDGRSRTAIRRGTGTAAAGGPPVWTGGAVGRELNGRVVGGGVVGGGVSGDRVVGGRVVGGGVVGGGVSGDRVVGGRAVGGGVVGGGVSGDRVVGGRVVGGGVVGGGVSGNHVVGGRAVGDRVVGRGDVGGRVMAASVAGDRVAGGRAVVGGAEPGAAGSGRAGGRRGWAMVLVAALGLAAGFALAAAWREHRAGAHPLRQLGEKAWVEVLVTPEDDPRPVRTGAGAGRSRWVVRAELREFRRGDAVVRGGGAVVVLASGPAWAEVVPGQATAFRARVQAPRSRDLTVAVLIADGPPVPVGALPWWQRAASAVRAGLAGAAGRALSTDAAGLLPALVLGDTSRLPDPVRSHFEVAGLQHLCVVSGANFTIVLTVVLGAARRLGLSPRSAVAVAAAALVMFVVVARPDPSVLRAAAMGVVTLAAVTTGRRKQALPALCAAVIGLLLYRPELAVSAGFSLSVLATGALILLAPSWADWLRERGWWQLPAEIVAVSAAAFTVTVPLLVALTGRVSLVAVAANVLVAPVIAPVTIIGAAAAAVAWFWSPLAEVVLHLAIPPLWWLLTVAGRAAAWPGAVLSVPGGAAGGFVAAAVVVAIVAALRYREPRRIVTVVAVAALSTLFLVRLLSPG